MKRTLIATSLLSLAIACYAMAAGPATAPAASSSTDLADIAANRKGNEMFAQTNTYASKDGETLYRSICQGCHMPNGEGADTGAGMYPALADNPRLASPAYPAIIILNGLRGMPSFDANLSDEQVAAVSNYVSTHFGNKSTETLAEKDVKDFRPKVRIVYEDG